MVSHDVETFGRRRQQPHSNDIFFSFWVGVSSGSGQALERDRAR